MFWYCFWNTLLLHPSQLNCYFRRRNNLYIKSYIRGEEKDSKSVTCSSTPTPTPNRPPSVSNPTASQNRCARHTSPQAAPGLANTLSWRYSDPDGGLQSAFEILLDDSSTFFLLRDSTECLKAAPSLMCSIWPTIVSEIGTQHSIGTPPIIGE